MKLSYLFTLLAAVLTAVTASGADSAIRPNVPWRDSFLIEYFSDKVFPRISRMGYQAVRDER